MTAENSIPPKPRTETFRPYLTRLPALHFRRRLFRGLINALVWVLVRLLTKTTATGLDQLHRMGPALMVSNHLGDADVAVGLAYTPVQTEAVAKVELYDLPVVGRIMDWYGFIWVHRGQPDRNAIRMVLQGLKEGRIIAIAPEGRESVTGALEEGNDGAAYIALKAGVPVIPVTFTGTENSVIFSNLKRLRRSRVTVTVGEPFRLDDLSDKKQAVQQGTEKIMRTLAAQLPPKYRGVYGIEAGFDESKRQEPNS